MEVHKRIRARQETVNRRLRYFSSLRNRFRHSLEKHFTVSFAVAKFVQMEIAFERPLFEWSFERFVKCEIGQVYTATIY